MSLRFENVKVIQVGDWNELVKKTYGKPYNYQQTYDCLPRGVYSLSVYDDEDFDDEYEGETVPDKINGSDMGVDFKLWLARDVSEWNGSERYDKELFWERNFYPHCQTLANDLCKKGLIEAGEYKINVDW